MTQPSLYGGTLPFCALLSLRVWHPLALRVLRRAVVAASRVLQMGCAEAAVDWVPLAPGPLELDRDSICLCLFPPDG